MAEKPVKLVEQQEKVEETVKPVKKVKPVVKELPQFRNNGDGIKIKLIDGKNTKWITVKHGEVVTIPRKIALANKLKEVK